VGTAQYNGCILVHRFIAAAAAAAAAATRLLQQLLPLFCCN
jgi:hypothetical protein